MGTAKERATKALRGIKGISPETRTILRLVKGDAIPDVLASVLEAIANDHNHQYLTTDARNQERG